MNIESCIELAFRKGTTGACYTDATCKTIAEAEKKIQLNKRAGWVCTKKAIGVYNHTGLFESEQIAYQVIG